MAANYTEHQQRLNNFVAREHVYPEGKYSGRGIVICAGGVRYFTNAYICVNILRMHGCTLPIQFWHLGPGEMDDEMRDLVRPLGVECVDAHAVRKEHPARILNGWELKPYAMIHAPFEEVICFDADNVVLRDPAFLFETDEYKRTGAIFWPDYGRLGPDREIWKIMEVPYRDEQEFETGQIVVDKRRCWKAMQVTMHLNEWSDFYYNHIHGDKETFHMAWHKIGQEYSMPKRLIHSLAGTMCQHDFEGNRIFQHRNMRKWQLNDRNDPIHDFQLEDKCLDFLNDLRRKWSKTVRTADNPAAASLTERVLEQRRYQYIRVGHDFRPIELLPAGVLLAGPNAIETRWAVVGDPDKLRVVIYDPESPLCELKMSGSNMLVGRWLKHEKMEVVLLPILASEPQTLQWTAQYGEDRWMRDNLPIPSTGVFVEVGAATGIRHSNTYWLEQLGWQGLLVEADERNLPLVKHARKVPVVHLAAASSNGEARFVQHEDPTLSGLARPEEDGTTVTVPTRRLDNLLQERGIGHVDLMSIDTEGTECDVLDGLGAVRPKTLIVEYLTVGTAADNRETVRTKLEEMGYAIAHETRANIIAQYVAPADAAT